MPSWHATVHLVDLDTGIQIGQPWDEGIASAASLAEARRQLRNKAWDAVDSRLNDVSVEFVDGPHRGS